MMASMSSFRRCWNSFSVKSPAPTFRLFRTIPSTRHGRLMMRAARRKLSMPNCAQSWCRRLAVLMPTTSSWMCSSHRRHQSGITSLQASAQNTWSHQRRVASWSIHGLMDRAPWSTSSLLMVSQNINIKASNIVYILRYITQSGAILYAVQINFMLLIIKKNN